MPEKENQRDRGMGPEDRISLPSLLDPERKKQVARYVRHGWDRVEGNERRRQNELKVNWLRYSGDSFAQIHPRDPDRLWSPSVNIQERNTPPTVNKLRRTTHRYMAQVTADEPVIEAHPASHSEEDRMAAEAASHLLAGEWERMRLQSWFQRAVLASAIMRSSFICVEWDSHSGDPVPAQKYIRDPETGKSRLRYVDSEGFPVETPEEAKKIRLGNMRPEVLTPFNVRWSGGLWAHDADEVWIGRIVTLEKLYEMFPESMDIPISQLAKDVPPEADIWMEDLRGMNPDSTNTKVREDRFADEGDIDEDYHDPTTGAQVVEEARQLDILKRRVFMLSYMRPPSKSYAGGAHLVVVGQHLLWQKKLAYPVLPLAHFKLLDEIADPQGTGMIDLLKEVQELLDFVHGHVLRFLQTLKRRWFVPISSNVTARDLNSPTGAVVRYNAKAGPPIPEQNKDLPSDFAKYIQIFEDMYNDMSGIHETSQGKHVPGVASGRHAEALRAGDETLMGLTRGTMKVGLEHLGRVILEMGKKHWTVERRVRYFGPERGYIERAFSSADFGDTSDVRLKRGTLLLLTPAQKLETIYAFVQMGALDAKEMRQLAPFGDIAGIRFSEDEHYKNAEREAAQFLRGPSPEIVQIHEAYTVRMQGFEQMQQQISQAPLPPEALAEQISVITEQAVQIEEEYQAALAKVMAPPRPWQLADLRIIDAHTTVRARVLAGQKAEELPPWWMEAFEQRLMQFFDAQMSLLGGPAPPPEAGGAEAAPPNADPNALPPEGAPPG